MKSIGSTLIAFLLLAPLLGNSQGNGESTPEPMELEKTKSWTDLTSMNGVQVQYKYKKCHDNKNDIHKENVLLRFENSNDEAVNVEWKHLLWYDGSCDQLGVDDPEFQKQLELGAGEVKKGDCSHSTPQELKVFYQFLRKGKGRPDTKLTGIRLANMKVE